MELEETIDYYHSALNEFAKGNPEAVKPLWSHRDDVVLANPWGPAAQGWAQVEKALDHAASQFAEGEVTSFERTAGYLADDLASIFEVERWNARVGSRQGLSLFDLRVTSIFRRENGRWKLVHRHADPISTPRADGPLH